jgi:hypothetical protein
MNAASFLVLLARSLQSRISMVTVECVDDAKRQMVCGPLFRGSSNMSLSLHLSPTLVAATTTFASAQRVPSTDQNNKFACLLLH